MNISVATAMANAALLEQFPMSSSACMIFFTRATTQFSHSTMILDCIILGTDVEETLFQ